MKENKLESAVNFPGFTTNVLPYYQGADIMLITSRFEGFCLSLMESKMCGLPLVTYNLPNLDSIRENKGMTVVRQNDIDGAAKAIIEILSDENKKKQMGNEARQSVLDLYSISTEERWQEIFSFIENADTSEIPYDSKSAAIRTMNYYTAKGIEIRSSLVAPAQTYIQPQHSNMGEITNHIAGLEATIKEIRSSTSYRLGWFLTMPFRKIKDKVKGQKYVE